MARNGFKGLEAIKNDCPNLVLSDIQMPGMEGFELLREIRALGPDAGGNGRSFICASGGAFEPAPSTSANRRFRLTQMFGFRTALLRASKSGSPPFPAADYDKLREKPGYHFNRMAAWNESSAVCELWLLVNKPKPI